MLKINVNSKYNFDINNSNENLLVNDKAVVADMKQLNGTSWHVIDQLKSYNAEVVSFNAADKTAQIKVNNNIYNITAKDQFDVLLDKLGLSSLNSAKVSDVKAPMPGLVLKIMVAEGDEVKKRR